MEVWIVESGDYEQRCIQEVADSIEAAIAAIKKTYEAPYIVQWEEPEEFDDDCWTLAGEFSQVDNYSTAHIARFAITRHQVTRLASSTDEPISL